MQPRQVEDHEKPSIFLKPHGHDGDQCHIRVAGSVLGTMLPQPGQDGVEHTTIRGEEEHPNRGCADPLFSNLSIGNVIGLMSLV